jgi:hypothetical protein
MSLTKVKPETKNHLLRLRKKKTTTLPPLLSTPVTPSLTAKPMTLNFWEELLHLPN